MLTVLYAHRQLCSRWLIVLCRFCFMKVIQNELDCVRQTWNLHHVTVKKNSDGISGKPNVLFSQPELHGGYPCGFSVDLEDVAYCMNEYKYNGSIYGYSTAFIQLVQLIAPNNSQPETADEGLALFNTILSHCS